MAFNLKSLFNNSSSTTSQVKSSSITLEQEKSATMSISLGEEVVVEPGLSISDAISQYADELEVDPDKITSVRVNGRHEDTDYIIQKGDQVRLYVNLGTKG